MTRIRRSTSSALVLVSLGAAGAPAAVAKPMGGDYPTSQAASSPHGVGVPVTRRVVQVVELPKRGFDWGDAGIGAAGGVALSLLGLGGALGVAQYRTRGMRSRSAPTV